MELALIVAVSENGVIGVDGDLPWRLPGDLKFFKRTTMGHHILMGRKTHESMGGRVLPGRTNVVVSRNRDYRPSQGAVLVHSLDEALALAESAGDESPFVIGGAQLYALALPRVSRLVMTVVRAQIDGDTHFPWVPPCDWQVESRQTHEADDANPYGYEFVVMSRQR